MERKITELEQKLLDNGFELKCKTYTGSKKGRVGKYIYTCFKDNVRYEVSLDRQRLEVVNYFFAYGDISAVTPLLLSDLNTINGEFENFIASLRG